MNRVCNYVQNRYITPTVQKLNTLHMSNFEVFKNEFQGNIVVPIDQDYAAAITRWVTSAERKAKIVAFVKTIKTSHLR
jgi:hypothetical protein